MMKSLFTPKVMVVEVTRGLDLEHRAYLTGTRVTVGSAPSDDLPLTDTGTVSGQLVFEKGNGERNWSFHTSDSAETLTSDGKLRAGTVRTGLTFTLSPHTQVTIRSIPMPEELKAQAAATKQEVPLSIALPGMAAAGLLFLFVSGSIGTAEADRGPTFYTEAWYEAPGRFSRALAPCLDVARAKSAARLVPEDSIEAPFQVWLAAARDGASEDEKIAALRREIGRIIVDAQFRIQQGSFAEAAAHLASIERYLPVSAKECPVNAAIQSDISKLNTRF